MIETSFHPLDLEFFDQLIGPLLAGKKINPDAFVARALRNRQVASAVRRVTLAIESIVESAGPPQPEPQDSVWKKIRTRLEQFDYRPDAATRRVLDHIDPELHLHGRPFFITEVAPEKVAEVLDEYLRAGSPAAVEKIAAAQLARLDPAMVEDIVPVDGPGLSSDLLFRSDVLAEFSRIHELKHGKPLDDLASPWSGGRTDHRAGALEELPLRILTVHARVVPYWTARGSGGLEAVCRNAGVLSPEFLVPAWRPFAEVIEAFPEVKTALPVEAKSAKGIGGYVAATDVEALIDFLNLQGARIIQGAARRDEGSACTLVLRKIRECATYAARHGMGYLEAAGVENPAQA
jgi:hypothetical protein